MVKTIQINLALDNEDYYKLVESKGNRTWVQVLKDALLNQKEVDQNEPPSNL